MAMTSQLCHDISRFGPDALPVERGKLSHLCRKPHSRASLGAVACSSTSTFSYLINFFSTVEHALWFTQCIGEGLRAAYIRPKMFRLGMVRRDMVSAGKDEPSGRKSTEANGHAMFKPSLIL
jgi:hypothetical protein